MTLSYRSGHSQLGKLASTAVVFFIFSSLVYFFSYPEADNDLWGHLFFGREISVSGTIPTLNTYSFTAPDQPWINHEWLAEVIFWGIYSRFGSSGLILLKTVVGAGLLWVLNLTLKAHVSSPVIRLLSLVWVMALLSPGFDVRPQVFTLLFFALVLFLLHRSEAMGEKVLFRIVPLTALWVNLHGGVVAGLGAHAMFTGSKLVGLPSRKAKIHVGISLLLSLLVLGFNPYGLRLVTFLANDLFLDRAISEWRPIPFLGASFLGFKLTVLCLASFSWRSQAWQRWDFWLAVLAGLLAFRHQRHTPLFAIAAAPMLARGLDQLFLLVRLRFGEVVGERAWPWLVGGLLVAGVYQIHAIGRIHWENGFRIVVSPFEYPTQASEFLQRNGIRGNLAVPFDWGEYFIWKLYPGSRISIDGRYTTAYPMRVIEDNWGWMEGKKSWKNLLERYPAEIAVTNRWHPVTALLRQDPEWVYIYSDPVAFVFVRKVASLEPVLEKFKAKELVPPSAPPLYFPG